MNETYLSEAVYGKYYNIAKKKLSKSDKDDLIKENRLSQIFSATFNTSLSFQHQFLRFIGFNKKIEGKLLAVTQKHYDSYFIDVLILDVCKDTERPLITIENKVDAPLVLDQLLSYNDIVALDKATKISIVKHIYDKDKYKKTGWNIFRWSDLHNFLIEKVFTDMDNFIIKNFLHYLEENQLAIVHKINKSEMDILAIAINGIRNEDIPGFDSSKYSYFYKTIDSYFAMLKEIFNEAVAESNICKKIVNKGSGRIAQFKPLFGYVPRKEKRSDLWIGMEIYLNSTIRRNKVIAIGTGIEFYKNIKPKYRIITYGTHEDDIYGNSEKEQYNNKDLIFETYKIHVLTCWKTWLKGEIIKKTK